MSLYRLYIDEVGNHDMKVATVTNPNEQFLTLFGVIVDSDYMLHVLQPEMDQIKRNFFQTDPDQPIIFHRKDIVQKRGQFRTLWEKTKQHEFDSIMLEAFKRWQYTAIVVTIDKKAHLAQFGEWARPPYYYCLQVLVERFLLFLNKQNAHGDVMIEARGKREDRELAAAYGRFFLAGSGFVSAETWQHRLTSKHIKINPKSDNIAGLQLADLLAHAAHYDLLQTYSHVRIQKAEFGVKITRILRQKKYDRSSNGKLEGYGIKLL